MVLTAANDSLELSFAKEVLLLTDSEYGFLVSIAGAGFILGAITNTILSKKLTPSFFNWNRVIIHCNRLYHLCFFK